MNDLISRRQAIDALECQIKQCNKALWDFIHIYGNYIDMGLPAVIKPLEIVYVGD